MHRGVKSTVSSLTTGAFFLMVTGTAGVYAGRKGTAAAPSLSVVIPIYNESGNIDLLFKRLFAVLDSLDLSFEVVAVDDGSKDDSFAKLQAVAVLRPELIVVRLRRNFGQTAAMMAAIDYSSGELIVSIDADLQNDPDDIPNLLAKIDEGYDVVSGWRRDRKDAAIKRNFVSRIANGLISKLSGVALHDYGCTLKAYRREVIEGVRLYGEMHRFIPIYAKWMGAKITELPVQHHPRQYGKSNYGLERILKVVLDLIVIMFLDRYFVKPIYVFGSFGALSLMLSFVSGLWMLFLKLFAGVSMIQTPLLLLSALSFLIGILSILLGLLAEILIRVYFESQTRAAYAVREVVNLPGPA